jgi:hypothetical protein
VQICGQVKSTDHIQFCCAVAEFSWCVCVCKYVLEWPAYPTCVDDSCISLERGE